MRIEEAKSLLSQGAAIGDVALRLGFCDAHHLARNFKRLEGLTPSAFRQLAIPPGNRETD
jgi:AraC-like DNA-binding protein